MRNVQCVYVFLISNNIRGYYRKKKIVIIKVLSKATCNFFLGMPAMSKPIMFNLKGKKTFIAAMILIPDLIF